MKYNLTEIAFSSTKSQIEYHNRNERRGAFFFRGVPFLARELGWVATCFHRCTLPSDLSKVPIYCWVGEKRAKETPTWARRAPTAFIVDMCSIHYANCLFLTNSYVSLIYSCHWHEREIKRNQSKRLGISTSRTADECIPLIGARFLCKHHTD